jgi:mersacidin/lichenicidin family type 2 lantibiotic
MSTQNIIRAWKDESYRSSLSGAELAALPANPAGRSAFSGQDRTRSESVFPTFLCCSAYCTGHPCAISGIHTTV